MEDVSMIRGKLQAEKSTGSGDSKSLGLEKNNLENEKSSLLLQIKTAKQDQERLEYELKDHQIVFQEIIEKLADIQKKFRVTRKR